MSAGPLTTRGFGSLDDLQLLAAVVERQEGAWCELLRRYRAVIFRCITGLAVKGGPRLTSEDAHEIFAETCLNLLRNDMRKLRMYDARRGAKLSSWLCLIAIKTTYDHLRRSARQPLFEGLAAVDRAEERPSALDVLIEQERRHTLEQLLAELGERDRRFFELYYVRGLSPDEIAGSMGISVKTVYSKKNKVRSRLLALHSPSELCQQAA